ncbi:fatty-acid amide hydrolase 1-like [Plakobranchus ocellatus]|uniref:Fatty-acid amide hydrolase 1-like n=1 Tax=Plakobranchus ocellatus TaxID=259542 RepID=A0AAV4BP54_9GAST|nr:fatty-acid amide hydrolase 1-like [Plakobranchus ocellatus]
MGRDVTSLVHFMRAMLGPDIWELEPAVPPMTFNEEMFTSSTPLHIGYFVYNNCATKPVPAVERAVLLAVRTLQALGHTVEEIDIKDFALRALADHLFKILTADRAQAYERLLRYDNSCEPMKAFVAFCKIPDWLRPILARVEEFMGNPLEAATLKARQLRTIPDWFQQALDLQEFQQEFVKYWKTQKLDIVIGPVWPSPANTCENIPKLLGLGSYCSLWNVLNFPAGVVPVTKVTVSDVEKTLDPDVYQAKKKSEKMIQAEARGSEGLPVTVQVAGLPYTEEMVLRVMAELEAAITPKLGEI